MTKNDTNIEQYLVCTDSMVGIFTGIYCAYELHCCPEQTHLVLKDQYELRLFAEYIEIQEDAQKAEKVLRTLEREFGEENYERIANALSSYEPEKADDVYHLVTEGLFRHLGVHVTEHLSNPYIIAMMKLSGNVYNEIHHLYGFLRFQELENGLLYARIEPRNNIMFQLMEHFSDRFPSENFIIHDAGRSIYAVHIKGKAWFFVEQDLVMELIGATEVSREEELFAMYFTAFCKSIAIQARTNFKLQRQMLPLRFRPNMTEFCH